MRLNLLLFLALACTTLYSCTSTKKVKVVDKPYTTLPSGIKYKIVKDAKGKTYPEDGQYVEIFIKTMFEDSLIFDSKTQTAGKPVAFPIKEPAFNGDLTEGIKLLTPGDSGIFLVPVDTLKANKQNMQPWMEAGKDIKYSIELVSIKTLEQLKAEKEKENPDVKTSPEEDDKKLQAYFKEKGVSPEKTSSGVYYLITEKTDNEKAIPGQKVTMNYTGYLMNGNKFDSNIDPQFGHVQPFEFILGRGQVIRGWDIGVAKLNKGEKATLYIPSHLAYGPNSPTSAIPPNAILIFDVELVK